MKKKKIMILISVAILLAYLASLFVVYSASEKIIEDELTTKAREFEDAHPVDNNPDDTNKELLNEIMYLETENGGRDSYPYAAAIYDRDGNLVVKSGSVIRAKDVSEKVGFFPVSVKYYYCFIDEYLTSEMKDEILDFCRGDVNQFNPEITSFDFNIENDTVIPIRLYAKRYDGKVIDFEFSKDKAQYTDKEWEAYWVNIDNNSYNRNLYEHLDEELTNFNPTEYDYFWTTIVEPENYKVSSFTTFFIRDEMLYIYEISGYTPFFGVVDSDIFKTLFVQETVLFAIIGIVLLLATNIIFNRSERLEKSRLAFTSAAAHELKTPLAVISNQCECIIENVVPEKNDEYVRSIYDETCRMNKMVATLLRYNRINSAKSIDKENVDISEIVNSELQKYDALIKDKNITTQIDAKAGIHIKCNAELIGLVIDNFLSNAVKHSPENGLIKLSVKPNKHKVTVMVFNKGEAIKNEDAKHIWEEFYREDKARNSKDNSTGMGLAICKNILDRHKFKYGFKNVDGGVEFSFTSK